MLVLVLVSRHLQKAAVCPPRWWSHSQCVVTFVLMHREMGGMCNRQMEKIVHHLGAVSSLLYATPPQPRVEVGQSGRRGGGGLKDGRPGGLVGGRGGPGGAI